MLEQGAHLFVGKVFFAPSERPRARHAPQRPAIQHRFKIRSHPPRLSFNSYMDATNPRIVLSRETPATGSVSQSHRRFPFHLLVVR
jgi:hypothetical protein